MKSILQQRLTLVTWLLSVILASVAADEPPRHAPRLVCDHPIYDFGEQASGTTVRHAFTIRNEGDMTLEILRVQACCGTVARAPARTEIPPGQTETIEAHFSLANRTGPQNRTVNIQSSCPENPRYTLTMRGRAITEVEISPRQIHFGQIDAQTVVTQTVNILLNKPMDITHVESSSKQISPSIETVEPQRRFRLHAVTRPPLPIGSLHGHLTLSRSDGPPVDVTVSGNVMGPLNYAPQEITLRAREPGLITRHVIIRPGTVRQFAIKEIEGPCPHMRTSINSMGAQGYRIQIDNIRASEELQGATLRIATDAEAMPDIHIPFRVLP